MDKEFIKYSYYGINAKALKRFRSTIRHISKLAKIEKSPVNSHKYPQITALAEAAEEIIPVTNM